MGILHLNDDVFLIIAENLRWPRDCLRLAGTCKRLRAIFSDEAVRDVNLCTHQRLQSFLEFILSNPRRPSRVRSLIIQDMHRCGASEIAIELSELLLHTSNLLHLELFIDYEVAVKSHPPLLEAMNALPRLASLDLWSFGPIVLKGFLRMRSRLRCLKLREAYPEAMDGLLPPKGGLESLEKLHLVECSTDDNDVLIGSKGIWPTVRSLEVWHTDVCLEYLIKHFPNVRKFTMRGMGIQFTPFHRDMSKTDFWPCLDHFVPNWEDMTMYGSNLIMPPTRRLTFLNTFDNGCAVDDAILLSKILQETQPIVLAFPVIAINPTNEIIPPHTLRPEHVWENLRCLTITLLEHSTIEGIHGWINDLRGSVGDLPLVSFCLSINRPYDVPLHDIQANLDPSHPEHLPTKIASLLKHTRLVGVDFSSRPRLEPYWWCAIQERNIFIRIPDHCNYALTKALDKMDNTREGLSRVERSLPRHILERIPKDNDGPILFRKDKLQTEAM